MVQLGVLEIFTVLSPVAEDVIVYYNKDKLKSLGLSVPTNFAEFENALKVSKDAGELPIALGGADGWPIIHVWGLVEGALCRSKSN